MRVNETLKGGARGTTATLASTFPQLLMVGQFALALVLLGGAAMFVRGLGSTDQARSRLAAGAIVTGKIGAPARTSPRDSDRTMRFYRAVQERLAALPGVENASVGRFELPLFGYRGRSGTIEGRDPPPPGRRNRR